MYIHFDTHKYKHVYKCTNLVFEKAVQHIFHIGNDLFEFKMSKSGDHISQFCVVDECIHTSSIHNGALLVSLTCARLECKLQV